jgi:transposase
LRVFGELGPEPIEVAFEATIGWGWFADLLADAGVQAHMAHPLATRAIATARVKNDAVDAKTLAHFCGLICCRRPGSRRLRCARRAAWCACVPASSGSGAG